nr:PREDICTED: uncharacterized protein LOC103314337 [Tribolium castaneum]XP_015840123.1 PREDICTED: uncharacterized protein LOC103314337 [Tribolium castaneum]|eukprot:XP_008198339.1 PREDICTED: uncharacterized protein LOC103314337 [Tribolium castaneum]
MEQGPRACARTSGHVCSVPGCTNKHAPMFRFPNPKRGLDICLRWRQAVNNPKWPELSDYRLNRIARVCYKHFIDDDFLSGTRRLTRFAVPSLNLPTGRRDSTPSPRPLELGQSSPSEVSLQPKFVTPTKEFLASFLARSSGSDTQEERDTYERRCTCKT